MMLEKFEFAMNKMARSFLPSQLRRKISDFPLVLQFNELLLGRSQVGVTTPEGLTLKLNPLFHGHLASTRSVIDYEPEVREALSRALKPGMVVYDVGANIGIFSLLMSHLVQQNGKVYAIEPEMNNYKHLLSSIKANNLTNIFPMQIAVGDKEAVLQFDRRGGSFSGRVVDSDARYKPTRNLVRITTMSIDSLVKNNIAEKPDLIKIDVEGFEGKVLLGTREVLESYAPAIICEIHAHLGDCWEVVYNVLNSLGYHIFRLEDYLKGEMNHLQSLQNVDMIFASRNIERKLHLREKSSSVLM
ncbi:MAG: FkbM family methyltransferase [Syntrophobacteraceae bacterium]